MATRIRQCVALLCLLGGWVAATGAALQDPAGLEPVRPAPRRIGTNLRAFGIPFTVHDPGDRYVEVQLYVSRDRGQTWNFHSRQPVRGTEFPFESRGDGEYWFAIRTLDRDRQLHPAGTMVPELQVVVDTVQPRLDFRIQTDASGRIVCRWTAEDDHLDLAATRIAFRPLIAPDDTQNRWMSVPYKPVATVIDRVFTDQYAWWPEPRSAEVLVQLVVADIAGNEAVEERQVALPATGLVPGQPSMVTRGTRAPGIDFDQLPQNQSRPGAALFEVSSTTRSPGPMVQEVARPDLSPTGPPTDPPSLVPQMYGALPAAGGTSPPMGQPPPTDSATAGIPWPSQTLGGSGNVPRITTARPEFPEPGPLLGGAHSTGGPVAGHLIDPRPQTPRTAGGAPALSSGPPQSVLSPWPDARSTPGEPVAGSAEAPRWPPLHTASSASVAPSPPAPSMNGQGMALVRFVNTRRFRLDYAIDSIPPEAVSKVVLWVTADQGQTWTAWAEDTDNRSPFPVEMHEPGLYGYRIVFHTVDGVAGRAPARGDDADVWIAIDLEPPDARLTGAPYGRGTAAGCLLIQWEAHDAMLRNGPVHLSWSAGRDGPWTTIVNGWDNRGEYPWKPDSQVPERVYLRLDVTDAAGNTATSATDQPVSLTGLVPRGRITDVEPVR